MIVWRRVNPQFWVEYYLQPYGRLAGFFGIILRMVNDMFFIIIQKYLWIRFIKPFQLLRLFKNGGEGNCLTANRKAKPVKTLFSANLRSNLCSCRKTKISNVFCYGDRFHKLSKTCLDLVICCKRTTKQKGNDAIVGENNKLRFLSQKKNGNLCLTQFSWKNSCGLAQDYWPLGVGIVIAYQNYRLYNILFATIER